MSTQLEFLMQLYMMNLIQQQQQLQQQQQRHQLQMQHQMQRQQQQQQQQQPTKPKDTTKNPQTCSSSSSSSCSPNNSYSSNNNNNNNNNYHLSSLQQLFLNNIPSSSSGAFVRNFNEEKSISSTSSAGCSTTTMAENLFNNFYSVNFSARNFLQSSTVTSTPTTTTDTKPSMQLTKTEAMVEDERCSTVVDGGDCDERECEGEGDDREVREGVDDDEMHSKDDDQLFVAAHTSSSTPTTTSGESSKLLISGLQTLESTDSFESPVLQSTPTNKEDSLSVSGQQYVSCRNHSTFESSSGQDTSANNMADNEDSNVSQKSAATSMFSSVNSDSKIHLHSTSSYAIASESSSAQMSSGIASCSTLEAFLQNEENVKNLKKYSSYLECENILCRQENLREHFHCFDEPCQGKILSKKDDIIRHLKWHKKRKESFTLGFHRFSASDDCAPEYGDGCAYNWKQTHYHCVSKGCPKVYVSTSDVQMHANYHRKNSEIVQEGFCRYRAIEDCQTEACPFFGKKTSHYHCMRDGCQFTFKNKADMEKHKSYHLKDLKLTQDGFKKILKTETCPFDECRFSNVCNHIHCVRENCNYILHSSSQLVSHKRKHDRLDSEQAYQNFKKSQKDSSEDDSPKSSQTVVASSTPLSSLSAESSNFQFLSRKRGRPPKKIQLSSNTDEKRIKVEPATTSSMDQMMIPPMVGSGNFPWMLPPFLPLFNPTTFNTAEPTTVPNFQLTHLMALFQLQNPLFYSNLYPESMAGMFPGMQPNPIFSEQVPTVATSTQSELHDKEDCKE